ncbi:MULTISPECIES: NAD(P)-dependent oxidoreductase [Burkholderiaceae]|uniref:NAD-dependent epimerase/dehydratase family protein n=1 Tax=Burkholderiaceae TaxID=119060 RepID=UPI00141F1F06|nr:MULTISPECIES: NAD(P)-dependent oxidoreductase [Burkholderiaceae]MBN3846598.1 NAD(P)-dependent oxidoreductase [Paraburkholderia sp. Ac-20342]NIF55683.1 NAD(P)-dependent oxidoreductase [Burkholderia sp. Ax-1724]NIF78006.1 NAD(P)-dependent oxidoreductase [Paraburkholderia sp. Cy-641]
MKVLITGGGGFLGAWIVRALIARGIDVRLMEWRDDRSIATAVLGASAATLDWRVGDVRRAEDVRAAMRDCDHVIHLAGLLTPACKSDPLLGAVVNVIGTLNVFEAARQAGIRKVLYSSSGGVYGPDDPEVPFPTTHYGAFKLANEGSARAYWLDHGIASIGFRPFVIYGPGRETGLTAGPTLACRAVARGEPYVIPYTGRSGLVFVGDVAAAYERALLRSFDGAHVVNQPGHSTDMSDVIDELRRIDPAADIRAEGPPMPSLSTAIGATGEDVLGALPLTPVREGLRRTVEHYRVALVA